MHCSMCCCGSVPVPISCLCRLCPQVTSLVAQSLDLPPQAARWRHQQRTPAGTPRPPSPAFHLPRVDADVVEDGGSWMEGQVRSGGHVRATSLLHRVLPPVSKLEPWDSHGT